MDPTEALNSTMASPESVDAWQHFGKSASKSMASALSISTSLPTMSSMKRSLRLPYSSKLPSSSKLSRSRLNAGPKHLWRSLPHRLSYKMYNPFSSSTRKSIENASTDTQGDALGIGKDPTEWEEEESISSETSTMASLGDYDRSDDSTEAPAASKVPKNTAASEWHSESSSSESEEEGLLFWEDESMHQRWESTMGSRQMTDLTAKELSFLVNGGMPLKYRHQLWQLRFSLFESELDIARPPSVESLQQFVPEESTHQIDLDVPRTQPRWLGEADRLSLRRVLRAYAASDPHVGYCQGMSNMAAVFVLLGFDEDAALRGLHVLVAACCPGYHTAHLEGYVRDVAVLGVLAREVLPQELAGRLDSLGIPLHMLAADHFLSLASHTWPLGAVVKLWDLFFLEGSPAVFASFLTLLHLYLPQGEQQADPMNVDVFLKAVRRGVAMDVERILEKTRELIPSIPKSRIESLRWVFSGDHSH